MTNSHMKTCLMGAFDITLLIGLPPKLTKINLIFVLREE